MALHNWKEEDGAWGYGVVACGAACGLLFLGAFYYVVTHALDTTDAAQQWDRQVQRTSSFTTGTGVR